MGRKIEEIVEMGRKIEGKSRNGKGREKRKWDEKPDPGG